jgi:hypothetical protein
MNSPLGTPVHPFLLSRYEFGLKIGTSVTAFEGSFYVDNVQLISAAGTDAPENMGVEIETMIYSFESNLENWTIADYWSGGQRLDVSVDDATDGEQSLALGLVTTGEGWQEGGAFIQPEGGVDWSAYSQLAVDVYLPEGDGFLAQIFIKTGDEFTWANTADITLVPGQWTTVFANLSVMGNTSAIRELGVKVGTSVTAFDGIILFDNVRLIGAQ